MFEAGSRVKQPPPGLIFSHQYSLANMIISTRANCLSEAGLWKPSTDKKGNVKLNEKGIAILKGKYTLHAFRHAAASFWIDQNINLKRLQSWMGHEGIQITIDTYGHFMKDTAKDAAFAAASEKQLFSQKEIAQ